MVDYYKILGLPKDATTSQIKARYQYLAKKHHPDHNGNNKTMSSINEAYSVLSNPINRFQYNQKLDFQKTGFGVKPMNHSVSVDQEISKETGRGIPGKEVKTTDRSIKFRFYPILGLFAALIAGVFIFAGLTTNPKASAKLQNVKKDILSSKPAPANTNRPGTSNALAIKLQTDKIKANLEQDLTKRSALKVRRDFNNSNYLAQQQSSFGAGQQSLQQFNSKQQVSIASSQRQSQTWHCGNSLYTRFTGPYTINNVGINSLCPSSDGGLSDLYCSGNINTYLVTKYFPYAQINMACSNQSAASWTCNSSLYTGFTGPYSLNNINLDLTCTPSFSLSMNELICTGDISTMLTTQSYPYAEINMNCSD